MDNRNTSETLKVGWLMFSQELKHALCLSESPNFWRGSEAENGFRLKQNIEAEGGLLSNNLQSSHWWAVKGQSDPLGAVDSDEWSPN